MADISGEGLEPKPSLFKRFMEGGFEEMGRWVLGKGEMGLIEKLDWTKGLEKLGVGFEREEEMGSSREGRVEEEEEGKAKYLSIVRRRRVGI